MAICIEVFRLLAACITVHIALGAAPANPRPIVHPDVYRTLQDKATVNLMVTMREGTTVTLQKVGALLEPTSLPRGTRIEHLVDSLKTLAATAQAPVLKLLNERIKTFTSSSTLWISNQLYIEDASIELLQRLKLESSIAEIHKELILTIGNHFKDEHLHVDDAESGMENLRWGAEKIGAVAVWAEGFTGTSITVAAIDTGVRGTHEALRSNFRGDYGWFDPETKSLTPLDISGHGTHVMGSIVGANGIGVAPNATWIACRGCKSTKLCLESSLVACAQFVLCPTDPNGNNANCSEAPRVVNNSWGIVHKAANFSAVIAAWQAAEIIPIFAIGNSGSLKTCGTVASPGDAINVIGVGATTSDDFLLPQSSTGPAPDGHIKPDIVAPGARIYSAWWTRDNIYTITSGTSTAAPHVAGAVALLLSVNSYLTYEQVWTALTTTAVHDGTIANNVAQSCGNTSALTTVVPNNIFGYGRLNVLSAVAQITTA